MSADSKVARQTALNFTPKAIEALRAHRYVDAPISGAAVRWIASLLEQAQVFILPDGGELLDRGKPRPEVPGLMFRPPFPVTVCEYRAGGPSPAGIDDYTAELSTRRIALAWEWSGLPKELAALSNAVPAVSGVAVISVYYVDEHKTWLVNRGASLIPHEAVWMPHAECRTPHIEAMIARGVVSKHIQRGNALGTHFIPLMAEQLRRTATTMGSMAAAIDRTLSDNTDEAGAYIDLCYALACPNVAKTKQEASKVLNRERRRKGRPELKDFHILTLGADVEADGEGGQAVGDRSRPRSHLRRGHIRRLKSNRLTWVNQTMVRGREGFVSKAYRMEGSRDARC